MFCHNCGQKVSTKFCPHCGAAQQQLQEETCDPAAKYPPLKEPFVQTIAGVDIDMHMLIRAFGTGWRKAGAYRYLAKICGITTEQAKSVLDPLITIHKGEKISFFQGLAAEMGLQTAEGQREFAAKKQYRQELENSGVVYCPKCLSTSVTAQEKGFSVGKALVGAALVGKIGLVAGALGSKKVRCVCLNCGHTWKA